MRYVVKAIVLLVKCSTVPWESYGSERRMILGRNNNEGKILPAGAKKHHVLVRQPFVVVLVKFIEGMSESSLASQRSTIE